MSSSLRVLVIDDEEDIRNMLTILLKKEGYKVRAVGDGEEGLKELMVGGWDLVLCDVRMPKTTGLELLDELRERSIPATVIVMSAFGNRQMALDAIKRGAYDYIDKPFKKDEILLTLAKAEERLALKRENETLKREKARDSFDEIIGQSEPMQDIFKMISRVAAFRSTILIVGESGTGKELVARALHRLSGRSEKPLIPINCGAIPENLLESELFGHVKGAFTDASTDKQGLFQAASGGTLFLDEIGELPLSLQVKLLRVLQESEVRRVGENRATKIDVRVIAASLRDLKEEVDAGRFREDLYYRLNVIQIRTPALRERPEDIPLLAEHFIRVQNQRMGTRIRGFSEPAMAKLKSYPWPGNVRELQNCIERAVVLAPSDVIDVDLLPDSIRQARDEVEEIFRSDELSIKKLSRALEKVLIRRALEKTGGNRTNASKLLEISHRALIYKIRDYNLEDAGQ